MRTLKPAEILTLVVLFIILAAVKIPLLVQSWTAERRQHCATNLATLWKMKNIYMASGYGHRTWGSIPTGSNFWLHLDMEPGNPQLIDDFELEIFFCPISGHTPRKGKTDYLGPRLIIQQLGDGEWIGADHPDNHGPGGTGGGNVLRKAGDILYLPADEFRDAARRCRP